MFTSTLLFWLACGTSSEVTASPATRFHPTDRPWIGDEEIVLPYPLEFQPQSDLFSGRAQDELLDDVAVLLRNHPEVLEIEVHGAAGELEAREHPDLVKYRAAMIKAGLTDKKVAPNRITASYEVAVRPEDVGYTLRIRRGLGESVLTMRRPLNFFPPTARFGPENDEPLGDALAILELKPDLKFDIRVSGAPSGPEAVPLAVKQQRAEAIEAWFVRHGVDGERLFPIGVEPDDTWRQGHDVHLVIRP